MGNLCTLRKTIDNSFGSELKQFIASLSALCLKGALSSQLLWESLHFTSDALGRHALLYRTGKIISFLSCFAYCSSCYLMLSEIGEWGVRVIFHSFFFRIYR